MGQSGARIVIRRTESTATDILQLAAQFLRFSRDFVQSSHHVPDFERSLIVHDCTTVQDSTRRDSPGDNTSHVAKKLTTYSALPGADSRSYYSVRVRPISRARRFELG